MNKQKITRNECNNSNNGATLHSLRSSGDATNATLSLKSVALLQGAGDQKLSNGQKNTNTRTSDFLRISETRVETSDGRVFDVIGREPYRRKDGSETALVVWESLCSECAGPFVVKTPVDFGTTKSFGVRHCTDHRLSKQGATKRWLSAINAKKTGGAA